MLPKQYVKNHIGLIKCPIASRCQLTFNVFLNRIKF